MVTQEQIARKLGISRQLVTFALAGYPQVSEKSRQRILAAARDLGYQPNPYARALRRKRTGLIGLWVPDQISTYYSQVARELNRLVKEDGQELITSEVGVAEARQLLMNVPVDGVIVVDSPDLIRGHRGGVPIVSMGAYCAATTDAVLVDLLAGTRAVMTHLLEAGFRRIAHATFMQKDQPQASRRRAYRDAMDGAGLKPEFIYYPLAKQLRPVAREVLRDYVQAHGHPQAIFCHSDDAALGVYRGLCDLKLNVPADVAVAGCDGIEDTEYLECPLTTLVQPVAEMCATAWDLLKQRIAQPDLKRQQVMLQPKLAVRESTRRQA